MQNKKLLTARIIILAAGILFFIIPMFNTENDAIYVISPWIYLCCFLFFTRTIEKRVEWVIFGILFLAANEVRYFGFLGHSVKALDLIAPLLIIWIALATIIPFFIDAFFLKKGNVFEMLVAFPLARVLSEKLLTGHQFDLSFTQFGNKWLIQLVPFTGSVFIGFLIAFVASAIILMIIKREDKKVLTAGVVTVAFLLCIHIFGYFRYTKGNEACNAEPVTVAFATGPQSIYSEEPAKDDPTYEENEAYLKNSVKLAAEKNASILSFSEESFLVSPDEKARLIETAKALAKENHICILLTLDLEEDENNPGCYNEAVFIDNEGGVLSEYAKFMLIPILESGEYERGDGKIPVNRVNIGGREIAVSYTICYDATFEDYFVTTGEESDLAINASWDWKEIDDINYRMNSMSAVASGIELIKPTMDGYCIVCNPYGRVSYKKLTIGEDYNNVYFAEVTPCRVKTLFSKLHLFIFVLWPVLTGIMLADMLRLFLSERKRLNETKKSKEGGLENE